jgi:hypothetical protein
MPLREACAGLELQEVACNNDNSAVYGFRVLAQSSSKLDLFHRAVGHATAGGHLQK